MNEQAVGKVSSHPNSPPNMAGGRSTCGAHLPLRLAEKASVLNDPVANAAGTRGPGFGLEVD
jgi:hypothetical protein